MTHFASPIDKKKRVRTRKVGSTMLAIFSITVAWIGGLEAAWLLEVRREARIATELDRLGAILVYRWRWDDSVEFMSSTDGTPCWLVPGDSTIARVSLTGCREQCLDEKLVCLKSLQNLRCLSLGSAPITDAALPHLAGIPSLEMLDLVNTPITDEGLRHLETCPRLVWLDVSNTRVSDGSVPHIGALKELEWISISGTQITPKGLADLREKLPGARIVSDSDQGSLGKPLDAASYLADWSLLKLPEGNPSITDLALESVFQE